MGRQLKHGRYSKIRRESLRQLVDKVEAEVDPFNVLPELALIRALLVDWVERYTELREALLAWHAAGPQGGARPEQIPDLQEAIPLLEGISRMVYRIEKTQSANAISRADFYRVMTQIGRVVDTVVTDPDLRERIRQRWLEIPVA